MRESEERYRVVTESASDAIITIDSENTILFVNPAVEEIFGYRVEELLGNKLFKLMPERLRARHITGMKRYNETNIRNIPWRGVEITALHKNGHEIPVEVSFGEIDSDGARRFTAVMRDITKRKKAEKTIRESESRFRLLATYSPAVIFQTDAEGNWIFINDTWCRMTGLTTEESMGGGWAKAIHPGDFDRLHKEWKQAARTQREFSIEFRLVNISGNIHQVSGRVVAHYNDENEPDGFFGTIVDITQTKRMETELRTARDAALEKEYKLRTLFTSMNEGLTQVDDNEIIEFVNDRLCEMTGYEREELIGKTTLNVFFDEEGRRAVAKANKQRMKGIPGQYEARLRKKSGEMLWVLISGAPIVNAEGAVTGTLGMFMNISERKRIEAQLLHDAFHDALTGLANRALFMDHLRMTIERCRSRHSNFYAVLFIDFDRFKVINDSLGHSEGDELLKQAAQRLTSCTRSGDLAARLGGDEFVILLSEMPEAGDAVRVAERIQDELRNSFVLDSGEVFMSASIGVALGTGDYNKAEDMLRDADIAMYRAKSGGGTRYQVFDQSMHTQATARLQLETELRQAFERCEFEVHYQPIVNLLTRKLNGFEALARWRHPKRGMISPAEFIPAAEETGLILPLGRWILEESCRQMKNWQNTAPSAASLYVSVNLSFKQFLQTDLPEQVSKALVAAKLAPRCLKLEITESHLVENREKAVEIMHRLRALGVELSLDDFGTGYSSLSYLHYLPIDNLKIDRSFVGRMTESDENREIVRTIIKLAQNLKMKTVAEGIETADQLAELNRLNCESGQGYFFSKPLEAKKAMTFIDEISRNASEVPNQPLVDLPVSFL